MTLYWHKTGPLLRYGGGLFQVEDLNPEIKTRWVMSRLEMVRLGFRCLLAALRP
jgi:hypothetical protein